MDGIALWAEREKKSLEEAYRLSFQRMIELFRLQVKHSIPITTVFLMPQSTLEGENFSTFVDLLEETFTSISGLDFIHKHKIKISVIGKWYDLPGRVVESIRTLINETKDYDYFFFNFCINYSGQEEIVDACKLIARKIKADKLDPESINKETIKENLYTSYFLAPDIIIKTGLKSELNGFLLWDSCQSSIYFSRVLWPDFDQGFFARALDEFQHM
jgi:undecaprenyl diphosphate synthase